jgi:tight adherence protein C
MAFVLPFIKRNKGDARRREIAERRNELSREQREELVRKRSRERPLARVNMMKQLLERFNLSRLAASPELRRKLMIAGYRQQSAVLTFIFLRFGLALGFLVLAILFFLLDKDSELTGIVRSGIVFFAGLVGFYLPALLVKSITQKRQDEMRLAFPDAVDLLVICVQAGLSIEAAFARVTEEISSTSEALSQEISLTAAELAFLGDRHKAYANFAERTGLEGAKSLGTALSQADKYGTPVGTALKVLSEESRNERMSRAETKAASLPAQLTVPMILFFLPVLFIVIIGPAVLQFLVS